MEERRLYTNWSDKSKSHSESSHCNISTGIIKAKKILNDLHRFMGDNGYDQVKHLENLNDIQLCSMSMIGCLTVNHTSLLLQWFFYGQTYDTDTFIA